MPSLIFACAILLVLGLGWWRRKSSKRLQQTWLQQDGHQANRAIAVESFNDMDQELFRHRCYCGGKLSPISEDGIQSGFRRIRVIHAECLACGDELDLFFETTAALQ